MVRDAVQQGRCHLGVAKDLHPLSERQIGGDDQGRLLIQLADQVKLYGLEVSPDLISTITGEVMDEVSVCLVTSWLVREFDR